MQIVAKNTKDLKPYENNPRKNDEAVKYVKKSIEEFGFKVPIVIDKDDVIVCGHTRWKAAKALKLKEVPCVIADDLSDEQIKAFRLADNKVGEVAEWDLDFLKVELDELDQLGVDMDAFGFVDIDFGDDAEAEDDDFDADAAVEEIKDPITQPGDIWQLGNHRLICGDSTDPEVVAKLFEGGQADLIVTDPPYNVGYVGKTKDALTIQNDKKSASAFKDFLLDAFGAMYTVLKEGGAFYVWYASREHINFESALNEVGLTVREQLIWVKNSLVLSRQDYHWKHEPCLYGWKDGAPHNWYSDRSQTTVLEFKRPARNAEHPTMKPVDLIGYLIKNSSKQTDVVFDPFGGSGSTLIACEQLNRTCRTIELDPIYCDVIVKRWEKLTGLQAVKA